MIEGALVKRDLFAEDSGLLKYLHKAIRRVS